MSVNTAHTQDGLGIVLFYGERLLVTYDGCKITLSGSGNQPNGKYNGSAYLTSHRVIFLSKEKKPGLRSLSMPFIYMKRVEIKQPTFGPNHIEGFFSSETNQWPGAVPFKLVFNHGGAIEFGRSLLELGTRASKLQQTYRAPSAPPVCEIYAAPPPAYTPFATDQYYNSFMQSHPSFAPPPTDYLYQTNAPPPYPGVVPPPYTPNDAPSYAPGAAPPPYSAPGPAAPFPNAGATVPPYPAPYPPNGMYCQWNLHVPYLASIALWVSYRVFCHVFISSLKSEWAYPVWFAYSQVLQITHIQQATLLHRMLLPATTTQEIQTLSTLRPIIRPRRLPWNQRTKKTSKHVLTVKNSAIHPSLNSILSEYLLIFFRLLEAVFTPY